MMATLTIDCKAVYSTVQEWADSSACPSLFTQVIQPGERVEYIGHMVGGMVRVRYRGRDVIINPLATVELA